MTKKKVPKSSKFSNYEKCQYISSNLNSIETQNTTSQTEIQKNTNKKVLKGSEYFYCEKCDYKSCKQSQYDRHLSTSKHKIRTNINEKVPKNAVENLCDCGKNYKHASSLWNHKKKCTLSNNDITDSSNNNDFVFDKEFVISILKQNAELQTQMMEQHNQMLEQQNKMLEVIKNGTHNTNNTNSHNKTFNLHFFLNETCKDAMNITDFVSSIQLQLSDLENMGDVGFINGMSNIIIKNLKGLELHERPLHCTDIKREVLYVKDEDKWDKETDGNPKIRNAIKHIAKKNTKQLFDFKDKYPDCNKSHSKYSDKYNKLVIEAMGGHGDNDLEKENKIIKKVAKEVIVDK